LGKWHGQKKNLCGVDSFWHAMAHTKACHGTHQGPGANLGFEAWETFQMSYNELINTLWPNGTGQKKFCAALTRFGMPWHTPRHAMAPTKACQGPGANLGFEAWDTFQMSYNELINTIWANGTGKKKICAASTRFGMPWHTPRHAMAPTKAPERTLDLKLGKPCKCLIMNL
jgi:hypothetical protein